MRLGVRAAILLAWLLGCSEAHEPPRAEPAAAEPSSTREARADEARADEARADEARADEAPADEAPASCTLEAPYASLPLALPADALALGRHPTGDSPFAIVAPAASGQHLVLAADTALHATSAPIEGLVLGLEPMGPDFLLLTFGACSTSDAARCFSARMLRVEGTALVADAPLELPQASTLRSIRVTATDGLVYVARAYRDARPTLDRFAPPREGALPWHDVIAVGEGLLEDEPVEMLALAADGAAWALLYRHGATEDPASGVVLATQLDEHHIEALHDVLVVESMSWVGTSIAVIAAFEFARPAYFRLGAEGAMRTEPRALTFGAEIPEPFTSRLVARALGTAGHFEIEVRDGAGDRHGEAIPLPTARAVDISRAPGGFILAWSDGTTLHLSRLRC